MLPLHGILVIDKPAGMTSAAVVDEVKRAVGVDRVGHTGTLDPLATGVLPVCVGEATKLATFLLADDKAYDGELCLGVQTDTLDSAGTVTQRDDAGAAGVDEGALRAAMATFTGDLEQVPPMFSAGRHAGRRLYDLARAGLEVERAPRRISVRGFSLVRWDPPRASFRVECSKGTYVRSLVADLGNRLGCGAHLTGLRRTRAGRFTLDDAVPLAGLDAAVAVARLLAPGDALAPMTALTLTLPQARAVRDGKRLAWDELALGAPPPAGQVRLLLAGGDLLAVAEVKSGGLHPLRVFTYGLTERAVSFKVPPKKREDQDR